MHQCLSIAFSKAFKSISLSWFLIVCFLITTWFWLGIVGMLPTSSNTSILVFLERFLYLLLLVLIILFWRDACRLSCISCTWTSCSFTSVWSWSSSTSSNAYVAMLNELTFSWSNHHQHSSRERSFQDELPATQMEIQANQDEIRNTLAHFCCAHRYLQDCNDCTYSQHGWPLPEPTRYTHHLPHTDPPFSIKSGLGIISFPPFSFWY